MFHHYNRSWDENDMHVVNGTVLMVLMGGVPGCSHDVEWGKRRQDGLIDLLQEFISLYGRAGAAGSCTWGSMWPCSMERVGIDEMREI